MSKTSKWLIGLSVLVVGVMIIGGLSETQSSTTSPPSTDIVDAVIDAAEDVSGLSSGQENAVDKAESYLAYSAFSRKGLIEQLVFEDYSTADATYAVDHVSVDWNEQAAKKAASYLDYSSFSRTGLVDQLVFEGFTRAQAEYGASVAY